MTLEAHRVKKLSTVHQEGSALNNLFAMANGAEDILGRGFLTTSSEPKGLLVLPNKFDEKVRTKTVFGLNIVDTRTSFAKYLDFDAKAKFGFSGGDASFRTSFSESYRTSARQLSVILTKNVMLKEQSLNDPHWRPEAIQLIKKDKDAFIGRYGDYFVRKLWTGGLLSLIYRLEFSDMEQASDFSMSFDTKFGGSSGAASFHQKLLQTATRASISIQGICSGVKKTPDVFYVSQGVDRSTGQIDINDRLLDSLLHYYNEFESRVEEDGVAVLTSFVAEPNFNAVNAPDKPRIDLSSYNDLLDDALSLDDHIDARLSKVEYLKDVAHSWNTADPSIVAKIEDDLNELFGILKGATKKIASLKQERLPFTEKVIPKIPDTWVLRKLRHADGYPYFRRAINNDNHKTFKDILKIPSLQIGMPLQVTLRGHIEASDAAFWNPFFDAKITAFLVRSNGTKSQIFELSYADAIPHYRFKDEQWLYAYQTDLAAIELYAEGTNAKVGLTLSFLI